MNDARSDLFDRLDRSLATLQLTFASLADVAANTPGSAAPPGVVSGARIGAVLSAAERDRISGQLRAVHEEVRALREALGIPAASATDPAGSPRAEP
jgi:hypothetical protein